MRNLLLNLLNSAASCTHDACQPRIKFIPHAADTAGAQNGKQKTDLQLCKAAALPHSIHLSHPIRRGTAGPLSNEKKLAPSVKPLSK